jgi:hypothetical protein
MNLPEYFIFVGEAPGICAFLCALPKARALITLASFGQHEAKYHQGANAKSTKSKSEITNNNDSET